MAKLTEQELAEFQALEQEFGSQDIIEPEIAQVDLVGSNVEVESPSYLEGAALSLAEGASFGMSGEIGSVIASAYDIAVDQENTSFADWSALYHKNKDVIDSTRKKFGDDNPISAMAFEVAGGFATGGMAVKALGSAAGTIKGATALGAAEGFGRTDIRDDAASNIGSIALGAAGGAVAQGVVNKFLPSAAAKASQLAKKSPELAAQENKAVLGALRINSTTDAMNTTSQGKFVYKNLNARGRTYDQFAENIKITQNGPLFQTGDDIVKVSDRAVNELNYVGSQIGNILSEGDSLYLNTPLGKAVSRDTFLNRMELAIADDLPSGVHENVKLKLLNAQKVFGDTDTVISLSDIQKYRRSLSDTIKKYGKTGDLPLADEMVLKVNSLAKEEIVNSLDLIDGSKQLSNSFNEMNSRYGDFATLTDMLKLPREAAYLEPLKGVQSSILGSLKKIGLSATSGSLKGTALAVSDAMSAAFQVNSVKMATNKVISINKVINALKTQPGKYQDLSARLISTAGRDIESFAHTLGYAESIIDLDENPVQRTHEDMMMKMPQIMNVVRGESPQMANDLLRAAQSGNKQQLASMLSDMARTPQGQRFIAPGTGWDGKAVTSMDLQEWTAQIKQSGQTNREKMRQLDRLNNFGEGPVFKKPLDFVKETIRSRRDKWNKKEPKL